VVNWYKPRGYNLSMAINTDPNVHNLVICANIFVRKDGKYLLLKRSEKKIIAPGIIGPFGGKVEENENPLQTAKRELFEEAGLTVNNVRLEAVILEVFPKSAYPTNWLIFYFSGDYESGELAGTEEGEAVLLDPEQILKENLFPSLGKTVRNILSPHDGTVFATFKWDGEGKEIIEEQVEVCVRSVPDY